MSGFRAKARTVLAVLWEGMPERIGDAVQRAAWPCATYDPPQTCLTAPLSEAARCGFCREQAAAVLDALDAPEPPVELTVPMRARPDADRRVRLSVDLYAEHRAQGLDHDQALDATKRELDREDAEDERDTTGSASRQHYIDTGEYLRPGEGE